MITKFNQFLNESIRDEMTGKSVDEINKIVDDKISAVLPGHPLSMEQIEHIINIDDLNDAMYELQGMINQDDGGVCGIYFSKYDDADEEWENAPREIRLQMVYEYLELEASYGEI